MAGKLPTYRKVTCRAFFKKTQLPGRSDSLWRKERYACAMANISGLRLSIQLLPAGRLIFQETDKKVLF